MLCDLVIFDFFFASGINLILTMKNFFSGYVSHVFFLLFTLNSFLVEEIDDTEKMALAAFDQDALRY